MVHKNVEDCELCSSPHTSMNEIHICSQYMMEMSFSMTTHAEVSKMERCKRLVGHTHLNDQDLRARLTYGGNGFREGNLHEG